MGSIDHLTRYIPNLAQTAAAMRPLLKKHREKKQLFGNLTTIHDLKNIIKLVSETTQNKHFDQLLETRIVCNASTSVLGALLEQHSKESWVAIANASRFLNSSEEKYSVNELDLLMVVWAIEHFKVDFMENFLRSSLIIS